MNDDGAAHDKTPDNIADSNSESSGAVCERENLCVHFWGVRGSIPSPGPHTVRYGGNTSCVSVEGTFIPDGVRRMGIFDAGTGIRHLGRALENDDVELIFLLSHTHWDHIQGFPFFSPIYQPSRKIYLSRLEERRGLFRLLLEQMDGTHFPLTQEQLAAQIESYSELQMQSFAAAGYQVGYLRVNHPGETYGFRADLRGASIVFIPDNELDPPYEPIVTPERLLAFCRDADLLIHDSQYTEADMPHKRGWGHSVISRVWELAAQAQVKHLVMFHHDPDRTDDELDEIQAKATAWFAANAPGTRCTVAYEGLTVTLTPPTTTTLPPREMAQNQSLSRTVPAPSPDAA